MGYRPNAIEYDVLWVERVFIWHESGYARVGEATIKENVVDDRPNQFY
jgi:hypothetical protein